MRTLLESRAWLQFGLQSKHAPQHGSWRVEEGKQERRRSHASSMLGAPHPPPLTPHSILYPTFDTSTLHPPSSDRWSLIDTDMFSAKNVTVGGGGERLQLLSPAASGGGVGGATQRSPSMISTTGSTPKSAMKKSLTSKRRSSLVEFFQSNEGPDALGVSGESEEVDTAVQPRRGGGCGCFAGLGRALALRA